ncbi:hypothetical protein HDU67_004891 [Dinochytrium kinnereticum]|nr:hypothetical protein HDU67_004891 [Dinochytrium kinnereticum]
MLELLSLSLGDAPDKAFSIAIDENASVSRLRFLVAGCTRHNPSELNLFAVKEGANLTLDDARIEAYLVAAKSTKVFDLSSPEGKMVLSSAVPRDPVSVQTHLPVTWLRDPTASVSQCFTETKGLRLLVALDASVVAGNEPGMNVQREATLPPPAYNATPEKNLGPVSPSISEPSGPLFGGSSFNDEKDMLNNRVGSYQGSYVSYSSPSSPYIHNYYGSSSIPYLNSPSPYIQNPSSPYYQNSPSPYHSTPSSPHHPGLPYQEPYPPTQYHEPHFDSSEDSIVTPPTHILPTLPPLNYAAEMKEPVKHKGRSRKFWILVWVLTVVAILVAVGVAVGVVFTRRSTGGPTSSSSPSAVTGGPLSTSVTSLVIESTQSTLVTLTSSTTSSSTSTRTAGPTSREPAGTVLQRYDLFETLSIASNPLSEETFFVPIDDGFGEIYYSNGSIRREFGSIHTNPIRVLISHRDQIISADESAIVYSSLTTTTPLNAYQNFIPAALSSTYRIRFGVSTAGSAVLTINDFYTSPTNNTGIVVIVPLDAQPGSELVTIRNFPIGTFPWCAALVNPSRLLVGTASGLVMEFTRLSGEWSPTRAFKAHSDGVRALVLASRVGLFYTAGLDRTISAWSLSNLAAEGTAESPQADSLVTYSGFGDEVYVIAVSEDETESGKSGLVQAFSGATLGTPPRNTPRWSVNVGFEVWNLLHQASSNSWYVGGNTKNPVRIAN